MRAKRKESARTVAFGGVFAALAAVIMSLGGLIPVATYVCPMLCTVLLNIVLKFCGRRLAWVWYVAVSILSLLLGPDKEAVAVFVFIGYYPIVKSPLEKLPIPFLWKGLLFNASILVMYWLLMEVFGMDDLSEDIQVLGTAMMIAMLAMGNLVFFLLDSVLDMKFFGRKR